MFRLCSAFPSPSRWKNKARCISATPVLLVVYGAPALSESCMQPPGFMPGSAMGLSVAHVT